MSSDNFSLVPVPVRRERPKVKVVDVEAESQVAAPKRTITLPKLQLNAPTVLGAIVVVMFVLVAVLQPRRPAATWSGQPTAALAPTAAVVDSPAIMPTAIPVASAPMVARGEFLFFAPDGDPAEQLAEPVTYQPLARYGTEWVQVSVPGRAQPLWVRAAAVQVELLALQDLRPAPTAVPVIIERQVVVVPAAPAPVVVPTDRPAPPPVSCPAGSISVAGGCRDRSGT